MMFTDNFFAKVEITPTQYKHLFYTMCKVAKTISKKEYNQSVNAYILKTKINQLEKKNSTKDDWIKKKISDKITNINEIKNQVKNLRKAHSHLKTKKRVSKKNLQEAEDKIAKIELKLKKYL